MKIFQRLFLHTVHLVSGALLKVDKEAAMFICVRLLQERRTSALQRFAVRDHIRLPREANFQKSVRNKFYGYNFQSRKLIPKDNIFLYEDSDLADNRIKSLFSKKELLKFYMSDKPLSPHRERVKATRIKTEQ